MIILMWITVALALWLVGGTFTILAVMAWPVPDVNLVRADSPDGAPLVKLVLWLLLLWPFTLAVWAFERRQAVKAQREERC